MRRPPDQCTAREPSKAPRLQLPEVPSPHGGAAVVESQSREAAVAALGGMQRPFPEGEGRAEQGRSLWWQRRRAARGQISSQRPQCADLSEPGFQASQSVLRSPFV